MKQIINVYCKHCYKPLGELSINLYRTYFNGDLVDGGRKLFCNERCYQKYLSKYFVEEYKGNKIYWIFREGKKWYIPYAGCHYGFKTVNDLKAFVDARAESMKKWKGGK